MWKSNRLSVSGPPLRVVPENQDGRRERSSSRESQGRSRLSSQRDRLSNQRDRLSNQRDRYSTASKPRSSLVPSSSRMSGIGIRGRTDIPKDPRPLSDKRYVHKMVKRLNEFLLANSYPNAVSEKQLVAPSSKDFFKIFEFIYGQLSPGYKMGVKMEEEVPKLFKLLGYPFAISKMHLFSVGTPHVWPNMCAALNWIIDIIETTNSTVEKMGIDAFMFHTSTMDSVPDEKIFFDYAEETYKAFMEGIDTFESYDDDLNTLLKLSYQGGNIEDIKDENEKLEQDLQIIGQKEDRLMKLQEKVNMERKDLLKLQNHNADLEQFKRCLSAKLKALEDDCAVLQSEMQNDKQNLEKVQDIYENQDMTPADVQRMKEEREQLKRQIKQLEQQEEAIDNDIFKTNIETAKISEKAALEVAAYNRLAADLKLIPVSAENADGQDYSLILKHNAKIPQTFEHVVKPKLTQMKKQCGEEIRRRNKQKYQQSFQLEQLLEKVNDARDSLKQKKQELVRLEADVDSLKQMAQKENRSQSSEKNQFEDARSDYESQIKEAEDMKAAATLELVAAQEEFDSKKLEVERTIHELEREKTKVYQEVDDHKKALQAQLAEYVERLTTVDKEMDVRVEKAERENERRSRWTEEKRAQLATLQQQ